MIRNISIMLIALIAFLQGAFADEPKGHVFDAKLIRVQTLPPSLKNVVICGVGHRYVVTLELQQDLGNLGKKGETFNFTVENPARDLQLNDYEASYGKSFKFRLNKVLRREVPNNAQPGGADQPATAPEKKSEAKGKPQPESKPAPR